jgi:hypothetical protein
MSTTLGAALVADLAGQISGSVLGRRDAGYDAARAVHNGLIDRKPDPDNVFHLNDNVVPQPQPTRVNHSERKTDVP